MNVIITLLSIWIIITILFWLLILGSEKHWKDKGWQPERELPTLKSAFVIQFYFLSKFLNFLGLALTKLW